MHAGARPSSRVARANDGRERWPRGWPYLEASSCSPQVSIYTLLTLTSTLPDLPYTLPYYLINHQVPAAPQRRSWSSFSRTLRAPHTESAALRSPRRLIVMRELARAVAAQAGSGQHGVVAYSRLASWPSGVAFLVSGSAPPPAPSEGPGPPPQKTKTNPFFDRYTAVTTYQVRRRRKICGVYPQNHVFTIDSGFSSIFQDTSDDPVSGLWF